MYKRNRRQKASDVFQETTYLFPKTNKFDEAFPFIKELHVEVIESGEGVNELNERNVYDKHSLPGKFIDCHNPMCYNGGFDIGSAIRLMEYDRQTQREIQSRCQGYEGSPKGRKKYDACLNSFKIKINIKYKNDVDK